MNILIFIIISIFAYVFLVSILIALDKCIQHDYDKYTWCKKNIPCVYNMIFDMIETTSEFETFLIVGLITLFIGLWIVGDICYNILRFFNFVSNKILTIIIAIFAVIIVCIKKK